MSETFVNQFKVRNLFVNIGSGNLNSIINEEIKRIFSGDKTIPLNINYAKILLKPQPFVEVNVNEAGLKGNLPVEINATLNLPIGKIDVIAQIAVKFESRVSLELKNRINTFTSITDITWLSGPDMSPPIIDFIVPDKLIRQFVEDSLPEISEKVNDALKTLLDLDTLLSRTVWHRVIPIPLKDREMIHLSVLPLSIEIYKMAFNADEITFGINSTVSLDIVESGTRIDTKYVPEVIFLNERPDESTAYLSTSLHLTDVQNLAFKIIKAIGSVEKAIQCNIEKILIKSIESDGIAIALKLKGALNGALSIGGKPVLDKDSMLLNIEDLSFNFSGKGILSSLKGNIALSVAKSSIRKQFPLNFKPYIEMLVNNLNSMISKLKLANQITLEGKTEAWKIEQFEIKNSFLTLEISTRMDLEIV